MILARQSLIAALVRGIYDFRGARILSWRRCARVKSSVELSLRPSLIVFLGK